MKSIARGIALFFCFSIPAVAMEPKFQGILGQAVDVITPFHSQALASFFLPWNPSIIYIGGYHGEGLFSCIQHLSREPVSGIAYVFEPNPSAFAILRSQAEKVAQNTGFIIRPIELAVSVHNGTTKLYMCHGPYANNRELERWSSTLPECENSFFIGPTIEVPCVRLDDWCQTQGVSKIDLLFLDIQGAELQVLKNNSQSVDRSFVIVLKTYFKRFRKNMGLFHEVDAFLRQKGFRLLAHWYHEGLQGEAIFIRADVYNSMFE